MYVLNRQRLKWDKGKQFDFSSVDPSCVSTSDNYTLCPCGYLHSMLCGSKAVNQHFSIPFSHIEQLTQAVHPSGQSTVLV